MHSTTELLGNFDTIIIGAGTAGCLLANRLSADPKHRVLLLEAGGPDNYIWIHIPVGYLYCIGNPRTDWCYKTEAEPGLNGRSILYARGKVLGGCSSINAMIYMRGQAQDYDAWASAGNSGWDWHSVLPIFKKTEQHFAGASPIHGDCGEWRVEQQRLDWQILSAWQQAAASAGIMPTADFNGGDNAGTGRFEVNQKTGLRWNTAKAFLRTIKHRKNLTILTHALTHKILFEKLLGQTPELKATGVSFNFKNTLYSATATQEVIVSGGAINTPQLLQLSGIGAADQLAKQGIAVVQHLAGVGQNLQDHLQLRLAFKVQGVPTLNEWIHKPWGKIQMALQYAFTRRGPLAMAPSQLGAFARSNPLVDRPNLQFHVQPLSLDKFGEPLHRFPAFTASVCNLRPSSRGTVLLKSADPAASPAISPNYLSTADDVQTAVDAIKLARHISAQPALATLGATEFLPGAHIVTDAQLAQAAGDIGTTIFHPVGTAKMGPASDPLAVVDARLCVHGIKNLRVVDASVMPTIISGNTNSPTLMIAEQAAAFILEDRPRKA
jgi:choline dehydrogenase